MLFNMGHTITAIKVQKRNPQRVAIYLDGEYAFGLARIVAAWLTVGKEISDEELSRLKEQDTLEVAYLKALNSLSYRPRSITEVQNKLNEKGFSEQVVEETIDRLQKNGLLNDAQFASTWVENRVSFHPRSQRLLTYELRSKGVAEEAIDQALGEMADDETLAYQAAESQARKLTGLEKPKFKTRLLGYLGRRGFPYAVIFPVVDRLWNELHMRMGTEGDQPGE